MRLKLPASIKFPITVTALHKNAGDNVERLAPLLSYTYKTAVKEDGEFGEEQTVLREFPAQFESPIEGTLKSWFVRVGSVLKDCKGDLVEIEEPCPHSVQYFGLCASCGKDMTVKDYTSYSDAGRATIAVAHDNTGLTVSRDEATRLEEETKRRLLKGRRLSLVVDLDQTIIHATVDPTVGEWKDDPNNINHEYVKDVRAFQLNDEVAGGRGCWYYVKMRPGLKEFLENVSKLYELHIYTMGTRAYALAVANIVDPDGKIFGHRVLSRDESGSMTQKSLQRLFPVDQKMVVIIDDREDVWRWSPNLIKVRPYNFFVGIGDINSSFLPKRNLTPAPTSENLILAAKPDEKTKEAAADPTGADMSPLEQLVTLGAADDKLLLEEQTDKLNDAIKSQQESRPLAKQQQALDEKDNADAMATDSTPENGDESSSEFGRNRHHLLHDDDRELMALEKNLRDVHKKFFEEYDKSCVAVASRVSALRGERNAKRRVTDDPDNLNLDAVPEIQQIMPKMKANTLAGCVIVFSGVIPLGTNIFLSDIGMWSQVFGAKLEENITSRVTHLVAQRSRTAKVRTAATRYPHIKIVTLQWLYDCISKWEKVPEKPYLIPIHPEDRHPYGGAGSANDGALDITMSQESVLSEEESEEGSTDGEDISVLDEEEIRAGLADVDWDDTNRELEEFLAEDDDDDEEVGGESGNESDSSMRSTESEVSRSGREGVDKNVVDGSLIPPGRKGNKRNRSRTPSTTGGESDNSDGDTPESRLAKRQKKARERQSSLRKVELAIPSPRGNSAAPTSNPGGEGKKGDGTGAPGKNGPAAGDEAGTDTDDGFDEDFERELMAELEEG